MPGIDQLEETLLVEVMHEDVGVNHHTGNRKRMYMSREAFNDQQKDLDLRVVRIVKPEGVTMAQHMASTAGVAAAPNNEVEQFYADAEAGAVSKPVSEVSKPLPKKAAKKLTPAQKAAITRAKNKKAAEIKAKAGQQADLLKAAKDLKIGQPIDIE